MPKPYPKEFREDVVRVAEEKGGGQLRSFGLAPERRGAVVPGGASTGIS
ncbi:hypothetical protein [Streptomyces prasinus]